MKVVKKYKNLGFFSCPSKLNMLKTTQIKGSSAQKQSSTQGKFQALLTAVMQLVMVHYSFFS